MHMANLAALAQAFEEHREKLLFMARRKLNPAMSARASAEDVLSDAYLKASARWAEFEASGMTSYAWLYGFVRDCLVDQRRFQGRLKRDARRDVHWPDGSAQQIELGLVPSGTTPSRAVARKELQDQVHGVLMSLKDEDHEMLAMRFLDQRRVRYCPAGPDDSGTPGSAARAGPGTRPAARRYCRGD